MVILIKVLAFEHCSKILYVGEWIYVICGHIQAAKVTTTNTLHVAWEQCGVIRTSCSWRDRYASEYLVELLFGDLEFVRAEGPKASKKWWSIFNDVVSDIVLDIIAVEVELHEGGKGLVKCMINGWFRNVAENEGCSRND